MKKIVSVLLIVLLTMTLVSCNIDLNKKESDITIYTVQFMNQNGEIIKDVEVEEGSYITNIPSIPGTTINGWENNGIRWNFETDKVYNNVILRPIVNNDPNQKQYQVTFYDIYGNVINQQTIETGSLISYVPNYSIEGYDFKGWQVNYQNWDFSKNTVNSNINLYPKVEQIYYISYVLDGGTLCEEVIYEFTESSYDYLPSAVKSKYIFQGWYLDNSYIAKVESTFDLPHRNVTLYAKFESASSVDYYYHIAVSDLCDTLNYWDLKDSAIGRLMGYVHNGFWGKRINQNKDGYEWYNIVANEKPKLLNPIIDGNGNEINFGTKYEFEVKVGEQLKYNTLSTYPEFAKYKGREVQPEDYLTIWKQMYNQFNNITRQLESLKGPGSIKGLDEYYNATVNELSQEELDSLWANVGYKVIEREGKWYIQVEFNEPCNPFYAMYYLSSNLYTPLPEEFIQQVGGLKYYGKFSFDNKYSPVDTSLSTGYYVAKTWEAHDEIVFIKNDMIDSGNMYNYPGVHVQIIVNNIGDTEAVFKEFLAGHLDAAGIPSTKLEEYQNHELTSIVLDSSTFKLNINSCTQEEWIALFGENGTVTQTAKENYWECEPLMSNDNFLRGLSYSINRKEYAALMGATPTANFFGSEYLSDPANGITYNTTEAHRIAAETILDNTDGYGYNFELAKEFFKAACDELIANGTYNVGDTIEIEIAWQTHAQVEQEGVILAKYIEDAFNSCGGHLKVKCVHWVAKIWSDVYYNKMMVGQFDLGFGSVSGSALNPINFLETLKSDNSTGFTLNWGPDTGKVSDQIYYDGMYWSYNALWQAVDTGAYINDGQLVGLLYDVVMTGQEINNDGSVTVTFKYDFVNDPLVEVSVSKIVACNNELYYSSGEYKEIICKFDVNNNVITATVPAEFAEEVNGFIGYDIYFDTTIGGVPGSDYFSFLQTLNPDSSMSKYYYDRFNEVDANAKPKVEEGGIVKTYVTASYEEKTKILGLLEKFAIENFITGITLYGDGRYVMYSDRVVPGSGSWDNYIPGYGYGVFTEGYPNGLLTPIN